MTREEVESQLKPCPFCDGAAELVDEERRDSEGLLTVYLVGCADCDALMGNFKDFDTPAAVAAEWNRRADAQDLADEVTRLRRKLAEERADKQKLLAEYGQRTADLHGLREDRDIWRDQAQRALRNGSAYQDALLACEASRHELREACGQLLQDMTGLVLPQYAAEFWHARSQALRAILGE